MKREIEFHFTREEVTGQAGPRAMEAKFSAAARGALPAEYSGRIQLDVSIYLGAEDQSLPAMIAYVIHCLSGHAWSSDMQLTSVTSYKGKSYKGKSEVGEPCIFVTVIKLDVD